jgi:ABC-type lipoprotein export system ATPase subunit
LPVSIFKEAEQVGSSQVKETSPPESDDRIIQMREVVKIYPTAAGGFKALNGINLDIQPGEFLGVLGKSGAGKSTLLNMISGVSQISSGSVSFNNGDGDGAPIHDMQEDQMALWRGRNLGIIYQSFELMPMLNLVDNVMLPQDFSGQFRPRASVEKALDLLETVELSEHAYKLPAQISGGQKQRVAIARALVNDPPLILADEPTGNLDSVTAETIFRIFERLVNSGKTIVMVTHDLSLAPRFSRRVYISDGELAETLPDSRSTQPVNPADEESQAQPAADYKNPSISPTDVRAELPAEPAAIRPPIPGQQVSQNNGSAIQLRNLVKTYINAAGEFPALKGVDLEIGYGQFVSIVGKSGSGKSTLLNMLTGIDHPTSGEVIIGGEDIYNMSESQRSTWRGRNAGIVFQFFQLLPTLTLLENTMLPMDYCNVFPLEERPERAMDLLKLVGLEGQAEKLPASVSSGQQQSAAIARALATDPPIILADEPTGNLDTRSAGIIIDLFTDLARTGKTILIVTHDDTITRRTDQTVILSDGEIVDSTVARALPLLNHPEMLEATQKAEVITYSPGTTIIRQGEPVEFFFLIKRGAVNIQVSVPDCPELILASLGPGQFFGEVELIGGGDSIASVKAAEGEPLELALIPKDLFQQLLENSPATEQALSAIADKRREENLARNGDCP